MWLPEQIKHRMLADMVTRNPRRGGKTYRAMQQALSRARTAPESSVLYVTYNELAAEELRKIWQVELAALPNVTITSLEMIYRERNGKNA